MSEEKNIPQPAETDASQEELSENAKRLNELDELKQQVAKRLKDNQRFLERFMDDDFEDEIEKELADDEDEPFEEL